MTFQEAKDGFKGVSIKPIDEKTGNSKGYFSVNHTVLIYKSEITNKNKNTKNGFFIDGDLYLLPSPLKTKLQMHYAKEVADVPAGIEYNSDNEQYKIPVSYLQNLTNTSQQSPTLEEPVVQNLFAPQAQSNPTFDLKYYSYSNSLLDKISQKVAQYKIEDSSKFFAKLLTKETIGDAMESALSDYLVFEKDEEYLINLFVLALVHQEFIKNQKEDDISQS